MTDDKVFAELQEKVAKLTSDLDQAMRQVDRLWDDCIRLTKRNTEALKQRDEARRMCCEQAAMDESGYVKHGTMLHFAESRGWDCFPQEDGK